jgi:hypothetical protein
MANVLRPSFVDGYDDGSAESVAEPDAAAVRSGAGVVATTATREVASSAVGMVHDDVDIDERSHGRCRSMMMLVGDTPCVCTHGYI